MINYRLLTEQVQNFVEVLYKTHNKPALFYHNLQHTESIVTAATQIANHYQLNDRDFFVVIAACWFHDVGYMDEAKGHEQNGAQQAAGFLQGLQVDEPAIEAVKQCILATKLPQTPHNLSEQIVCDADLFHLGTDTFSDNNKLLRKEVKALYNIEISKDAWRAKTIELLQNHHYHTSYCQTLLNEKKQENLATLLEKQQNAKQDKIEAELLLVKQQKEGIQPMLTADNEDTGKKKKSDRPDKGIETMFRISSSNHQRLSDMADNKSHIMITVNSIIISVVASLLLRKLDTNDYLTVPAIMLLLVSLVTIVLAILATRPHIPNGTFAQADLDEKKVNLLFFGNFYNMSLESYQQGMEKVMNDSEFLYGTLIRDIYSQGVVLGRKYKLLRAAYNIFMFGLVVSVVAFIVASLMTTGL